MRLEYRYCLTEDGKCLVKDTHPDAHTLLYIAGSEISEDEAKKWGLSKPVLNKPEATKQIKPTNKEGS